MATDWTCAIVPFFIVSGLQMPRRQKVSVCAILGLGIFASIATCIRMPYLKYYDTVLYPTEVACMTAPISMLHLSALTLTDFSDHLGVISITSNVECSLGIIGCSLPPLRKLFKFYYGSSHDANYKITGDVSILPATASLNLSNPCRIPYHSQTFKQSQNVLGSSGPAIKLSSINDHDRTYSASAKRAASPSGELEVDDDDSSGRGIIRRTEVNISSSASRG